MSESFGSSVPRLLALSTAVPSCVLKQADVMAAAEHLFEAENTEIRRLLPAYRNAGIAQRYSCVPLDWHEKPRSWEERNRLYLKHAVDLLEKATLACLETAGLGMEEVDGIVVVSTTGLATPSLDARLLDRLAMPRRAWRLPIFGLGCAGGVLGLARSAALALARPNERVLFLVVELCALTFRSADRSKSNIIAAALFGDGAAAAIVSCDGDGPAITGWGEHTWPASLDVMGWHIQDDGFGVLFSRDIPGLIRTHLRPAADDFLRSIGLRIGDIDRFVCHPGGAKVVDALEEAFGLASGTLEHTRAVLRDFGNMSAASALFVLDRLERAGGRGRYLLTALGPGFTAGFLTMESA